jgi:hypothetical protein
MVMLQAFNESSSLTVVDALQTLNLAPKQSSVGAHSQVVFSFDSAMILVTADDADMILYTARKTKLEEVEPEDLLDVFR